MLRRLEPPDEKVETTTLPITIIEFYSFDKVTTTIVATNSTFYEANHHAKLAWCRLGLETAGPGLGHGFSNFFVLRPVFKKFFLSGPSGP